VFQKQKYQKIDGYFHKVINRMLIGSRLLVVGCWMSEVGCQMSDVGCWKSVDVRCWNLGFGIWYLEF